MTRVALTADSECHACGGSGVRGDVVRAELCVCVSAEPAATTPTPAVASSEGDAPLAPATMRTIAAADALADAFEAFAETSYTGDDHDTVEALHVYREARGEVKKST